jgi:hypothetical protein
MKTPRPLALAAAWLGLCSLAASATPSANGHSLVGRWWVMWTADGRVTSMNIRNVAPGAGVTAISGEMEDGGETCALAGSVIDRAQVMYYEGIEATRIAIDALVTMTADCPSHRLKLEFFGMPVGEIQMSGRATLQARDGVSSVAPIALSRGVP